MTLATLLRKHLPTATSVALGAYGSYRIYTTEGRMPGERPPNFSWIVDGVLAGSSFPAYPTHFQYYLDQGIRHIISLTEWKPPLHMAPQGLTNLYMPVVEFEPPSLEQIKEFVEYVDDARNKKEACVVHCYWGRGRTGTMLAAYLVKDQAQDPRDAIEEVRTRRPYSVETYEQEAAVYEYARWLQRNAGGTGPDDGGTQTGE